MIHYAPSSAPLPTPNGGEVVGHFTTLAIGFAAFQVFSVDFVEAEVPMRGACDRRERHDEGAWR
jgi:hypothetical protein